jgi:hypothetical protein
MHDTHCHGVNEQKKNDLKGPYIVNWYTSLAYHEGAESSGRRRRSHPDVSTWRHAIFAEQRMTICIVVVFDWQAIVLTYESNNSDLIARAAD